MSIGLASDRLLNGLTRQSALQTFRFTSTPAAPANGLDECLSLPDAQLASLRRALECDFGPDLSGIRVYLGPKAGPAGTSAFTDYRFDFRELRFKQT
jgi:hypothetical protein